MTNNSDFEQYNAQKDKARALALSLVRCSSLLWDVGQEKLRFDWAETAGKTVSTASYLSGLGALSPRGRFIAVENDPDVLAGLPKRLAPFGDKAALRGGDFRDIFTGLQSHTVPKDLARIGVAVADLSWQIPNPKTCKKVAHAIQAGLAQCDRIGEFFLVINPTDQKVRKGAASEFFDWLNGYLQKQGFKGQVQPFKYSCKGGGGHMYFTPICFGFEASEGGIPWLR